MLRVLPLGAGTPTPTPSRFGSSTVVEVGGEYLMFDCGPATTHKLVKAGLFPTQIDYLFFTHHHFDHDVDYPCFLLCRWDQGIGQENELRVFGPPPTEEFTHSLLDEETGSFRWDWLARVHHPASQLTYALRGGTLPRKPPYVNAKDIGVGPVHASNGWSVTAGPAEHVQPWLDSLAYRLETPEGSIVFTGDTHPCQSVVDLAKGADLLVCMCWDDQEIMAANGDLTAVCGTTGAAEMARDAGVKTLLLTHMGKNIASHGPLEKGLADVGRVFDGRVLFAEEMVWVTV